MNNNRPRSKVIYEELFGSISYYSSHGEFCFCISLSSWMENEGSITFHKAKPLTDKQIEELEFATIHGRGV